MDGCPDPPGDGNFSSPQQLQQLSQQPHDYGDVVDRHSLACVFVDLSEVASETRAFEGVRFFIEHTVQHQLGPQPAFWHLPACVCDSLFDEDPSRFPSCVSLRHQSVNARHCSYAIAVDQRRYQQVLHLPSSTSQLSSFFLHISSFMFRVSHMTCIIGFAVQHKLGPQPAFWHLPACVCGGLFEEACAVCLIFHPSLCILRPLCSFFMFHLSHLTFLIALAVQHKLGPQTAFWHSPARVRGGLFEVACAVCVLFHLSICILHLLCSFFMFHLSHVTFLVALAVQHGLGPQPAFWHSPAFICGGLFEVACTVCVRFHFSFCIFHPSCSFFMFHLSLMTLFVRVAAQHTLGLQPAFRHSPACIHGSLLEELFCCGQLLVGYM